MGQCRLSSFWSDLSVAVNSWAPVSPECKSQCAHWTFLQPAITLQRQYAVLVTSLFFCSYKMSVDTIFFAKLLVSFVESSDLKVKCPVTALWITKWNLDQFAMLCILNWTLFNISTGFNSVQQVILNWNPQPLVRLRLIHTAWAVSSRGPGVLKQKEKR